MKLNMKMMLKHLQWGKMEIKTSCTGLSLWHPLWEPQLLMLVSADVKVKELFEWYAAPGDLAACSFIILICFS